jgi:hypothetical protein
MKTASKSAGKFCSCFFSFDAGFFCLWADNLPKANRPPVLLCRPVLTREPDTSRKLLIHQRTRRRPLPLPHLPRNSQRNNVNREGYRVE